MKTWQYYGLITNMFVAAIVVLSGSVQAAVVLCAMNLVVAIIVGKGVNHDSNQ